MDTQSENDNSMGDQLQHINAEKTATEAVR